jgi:hypothetical protein
MGDSFRETDADGFTMSITVNTGYFPTEAEARDVWTRP